MQASEIKALLENAIEQSEVEVAVEGNHVNVIVVSPAFAGLTPVKKQQLVYAALNEQIGSGVIHAVHMKTYTPEQKAQLSS